MTVPGRNGVGLRARQPGLHPIGLHDRLVRLACAVMALPLGPLVFLLAVELGPSVGQISGADPEARAQAEPAGTRPKRPANTTRSPSPGPLLHGVLTTFVGKPPFSPDGLSGKLRSCEPSRADRTASIMD
jgi:hypothetical protein